MKKKFIGFFQFVEACRERGCPICGCVLRQTRKSLEGLLHENVNDPGIRSDLRKSRGFCNWHAALLKEIRDSAFGVSILCADFLISALEEARNLPDALKAPSGLGKGLARLRGKARRHPLVEAFRTKSACFFCSQASAAEKTQVETLLDFIEDSQLRRAFVESDGLCVPHFVMALDAGVDKACVRGLVQHTIAHWERLRKSLESFRDKHDWFNREEFTPEEGESWSLVLDLLSGAPGLFANHMRSAKQEIMSSRRIEPEEVPADSEILKFQKEKLELEVKELVTRLNACESRSAALNYKLWEVSEDRKILEMNLTGSRASEEMSRHVISRLREEVGRLREELRQYQGSDEP